MILVNVVFEFSSKVCVDFCCCVWDCYIMLLFVDDDVDLFNVLLLVFVYVDSKM